MTSSQPLNIRHIIFDLDGTLVDTEEAASVTILSFFSSHGYILTREDTGVITGRTWASSLEILLPRFPIPEMNAEQVLAEMKRIYRKSLTEHFIVVPGAREAVSALMDAYPLALVSGSSRDEVRWALERLGVEEDFRVVYGCEDYPHSKPAPDGFLKAMKFLDAKPSETLIFEDSYPGIAAARAAGAWVVGITKTNHFRHDQSQAHWLIEDLRDVTPGWVSQLKIP